MCSDNGMIYQEAGIIMSPGHPNDYPGRQECHVTLYNDFTHCVSNGFTLVLFVKVEFQGIPRM